MLKKFFSLALLVSLSLGLSGCINNVPTMEEQAKAKWAEVQVQYQRRADLIPNLVSTVKGYAAQEKSVLTAVTEARAKATSVTLSGNDLSDASKFRQFEASQGELSRSLGRLLMVQENYPDLKSNQNFLALQSQLEGTENRIAIARRDYNEAVRVLNTELRTIPGRWVAAILYPASKPMEMFQSTTEAAQPVEVKF